MKFALVLALCAAVGSYASMHTAIVPCDWSQAEVLQLGEAEVPFVLSLKEPANAMDAIKQTAMAVSDPDSASYGQFLTSSQIAELVAPAPEDIDIVTSWLT